MSTHGTRPAPTNRPSAATRAAASPRSSDLPGNRAKGRSRYAQVPGKSGDQGRGRA
ncbi:hypothetical protein ACFQZ4_26145 [Catellatospora coxensis]